MGLALALVLRERLWWLAMLFGAGMTAVAAAEAVSQPSASYEARAQHRPRMPSGVAVSCASQAPGCCHSAELRQSTATVDICMLDQGLSAHKFLCSSAACTREGVSGRWIAWLSRLAWGDAGQHMPRCSER